MEQRQVGAGDVSTRQEDGERREAGLPASSDPTSDEAGLSGALARLRACAQRDQRLWELLGHCVGPVSIEALVATIGSEAIDAVEALRDAERVVGTADGLMLTAPALRAARLSWPVPSSAAQAALSRLYESLRASPPSATRLRLSCSALVATGRAGEAMEELALAVEWRRALPIDAVQQLLTRIAAADALLRPRARRLLADEQLQRGRPRRALLALEDDDDDERALLLRCTALMRMGAADHARLVLDQHQQRRVVPALELPVAEIELLSGEIASGRARAEALRFDDPVLEARRATLLALAATLEEDELSARCEVARAREQMIAAHEPSGMLLLITGLLLSDGDEIDRLRLLAEAAPTGSRPLQLLGLLALLRQGNLRDCLDEGERVLDDCEQEEDRLAWLVTATLLARAAHGLGQLGAAERWLRAAESTAKSQHLLGLLPLCHLARMLVSATLDDWSDVAARVRESAELWPGSPRVAVELEWIDALPGRALTAAGENDALNALLRLRESERALFEGRLDEADRAARAAERWYRSAGAPYERCLTLLARSEVLARRAVLPSATESDVARALKMIAFCDGLARSHGYTLVRTALSLVRASLADRAGDLEGYVAALAGLAYAPRDLWSAAVVASWERVGFETSRVVVADGQPLRSRIRRLGLDRACDRLLAVDDRVFLAAAEDPPPAGCRLVLDVGTGRLGGGDDAVCHLTPQATHLLAAMVEQPEGLSLEALYVAGWGSEKEFHPLRHRNAIYVALNRLRATIARALDRNVIVRHDDLYAVEEKVALSLSAGPLRGDGPSPGRRAYCRWRAALAAASRPASVIH